MEVCKTFHIATDEDKFFCNRNLIKVFDLIYINMRFCQIKMTLIELPNI